MCETTRKSIQVAARSERVTDYLQLLFLTSAEVTPRLVGLFAAGSVMSGFPAFDGANGMPTVDLRTTAMKNPRVL